MTVAEELHLTKSHQQKYDELKKQSIGQQNVNAEHETTYAEGIAKRFPDDFKKTHIEDLLHFTANELGKTGYAIKDDGDKIAHLFTGKSGAVHVLFTPKTSATNEPAHTIP